MNCDSPDEEMHPGSPCAEGNRISLQSIKAVAGRLQDPIIAIDGELKILCVNDASEALYGYAEHDLVGMPLDTVHALPDHVHEEIRNKVRSGKIWEGAHQGRKSDGSTFFCKYSIVPFIEDDGCMSSSICILREVTRCKVTHEDLFEYRGMEDHVLSFADLGVWNYHVPTGELVADDRFSTLWQCSPDSMSGMFESFDVGIHPDDLARVIQARRSHREGKPPVFEAMFRVRKSPGSWVCVLSKAKITQRDEYGEPVRIMGICQDITRLMVAEQSIRESEEILRATFNAIDSGIVIVGNDDTVSQMNRQFADLWRIPADIEVINNNAKIRKFIIDQLEDPESLLPKVNGLNNSVMDCLDEIRFKDGRVYERFSCPLVRNGKVRGRIFNYRDITKRIQGEEEKKRLEARLIQAHKMEALGRLAGGIAHDFNNILSAVIGYAELALDEIPPSSRGHLHLNGVLKAADRAKDLISHILTFGRQKENHHSPMEIGPIVKETVKMLYSVLPATIEIRQKHTDSGMVLSDPTQIHRVLMNLCTNAAHAMDNTGGVLEVNLERVRIDGGAAAGAPDLPCGPYMRLTVSDTGHGIPPGVMDQIYDPYFTTKELGKGTGLGLSVVHGIVKDHGGAIVCRSTPGQGTSFDVYFPELESSQDPVIPQGEEPLPGGTERILFIDDEPVLVDLAKKSIESLGYAVVTRTSSIEALELFRNDPGRFDLVITDMTMPGMTGDRLAQRLKEIRQDIPIILCTGYSECVTQDRVKEIGISEYILKPLLKREIAQTLRKVLDNV